MGEPFPANTDAGHLLEQFVCGVTGAEVAVVVDRAGRVVASVSAVAGCDTGRLAVLVHAMTTLAGTSASLLETGPLETALVGLGGGHLLVRSLGGGLRLAVVTSDDTDLAVVERRLARLGPRLRVVVDPARREPATSAPAVAWLEWLTRIHPDWEINRDGAGLSARRLTPLPAEGAALGLVETLQASSGPRLAARLAVAEAVADGVEAVTSLAAGGWGSIEPGVMALLAAHPPDAVDPPHLRG